MAAFEAARFNHSRTSPRRCRNVVEDILAGVWFRNSSQQPPKVPEPVCHNRVRGGAASASACNRRKQKAPPLLAVLSKTSETAWLSFDVHRIRQYKVEEQPNDDEVGQYDQGPCHVMPDHFTFTADKPAGGNAHAGGLRRNGLADFSAQ